MYTQITLRNGNTKLQNSRRTKYCIYDARKKRVTFNAGVNMEAVKQFEIKMRRK